MHGRSAVPAPGTLRRQRRGRVTPAVAPRDERPPPRLRGAPRRHLERTERKRRALRPRADPYAHAGRQHQRSPGAASDRRASPRSSPRPRRRPPPARCDRRSASDRPARRHRSHKVAVRAWQPPRTDPMASVFRTVAAHGQIRLQTLLAELYWSIDGDGHPLARLRAVLAPNRHDATAFPTMSAVPRHPPSPCSSARLPPSPAKRTSP